MIRGDDHPWASARDEFESRILPKLEAIGKEIGLAGRTGNQDAIRVMNYYAMLHRSFDAMTVELLKRALADYERTHMNKDEA